MAVEPFDLSRIRTTSLFERPSKVSTLDWVQPAEPPENMAGALSVLEPGLADDLQEVARRVAAAHKAGKQVILGYGAHLIKTGLSPLVADLIKRGIVTAVITNGAGAIHDLEFALAGKTSESVEAHLPAGTFGMAAETAEHYNAAAVRAAAEDIGLGRALGEALIAADAKHGPQTILGACAVADVFAGVFTAIGTDIVHMHPSCNAAALGAASHRDFRCLCTLVSRLSGGVYLNVGSAVILPEVFLKCVSVAINTGSDLTDMTTVNMDMITHYRPTVNVVTRPPGRGFNLKGRHEVLVPLLRFAILHEV